jgi:Protein of unknown function (DUF2934)
MAQEKARATRARTTRKAGDEEPLVTTAAKAPRKRAPRRVPVPTHDAIAAEAYLMWERGEPGDSVTHWLRAERALAA